MLRRKVYSKKAAPVTLLGDSTNTVAAGDTRTKVRKLLASNRGDASSDSRPSKRLKLSRRDKKEARVEVSLDLGVLSYPQGGAQAVRGVLQRAIQLLRSI